MKALVLFISHYGNTKQVAETIAKQITDSGHEAVVQDLRQKLPDLHELRLRGGRLPNKICTG